MSADAPAPAIAPAAVVAAEVPPLAVVSLAVAAPSEGAAAGAAGEALQAAAAPAAAAAAPAAAATGVVAAVVAAAAAAAAAIRDEPFYWERQARGDGGGAAAAAGDAADAEVQIVTVVRDNVRWWALQLFTGIEYMGEVFAEFLGMTGSRYDWALEAAEQMRVRAPPGRAREAAAASLTAVSFAAPERPSWRRAHSSALSSPLPHRPRTRVADGGGRAGPARGAARAVGGDCAAGGGGGQGAGCRRHWHNCRWHCCWHRGSTSVTGRRLILA